MYERTCQARPTVLVAALVALLLPGLAMAVPKVVVPGATGNLHAAGIDQVRPLSESIPVTGAVARSVGYFVNGVADSKLRSDLNINGFSAVQDPTRGLISSFNGPGRFGWELPTAILSSKTQILDGKALPYGMGVSLMYRHHLAAAQRVNGWAPLVALGQLNQPWAFAILLKNGVPVVAYKQQTGAFFDLGAQAVGHQPTLRIDDGKWHHLVLNFSQPANPSGCGGVANATCAGRGLLRLFVDGQLVDEYHATLTSNIRQVTVGALAVSAGEYSGQNNWQASPPMLLARGQIDDLALYQRALSGQEIAKLQHRAETGLIAVWPDPSATQLGLTKATFPGAAGEANSQLVGFVPKTDPLFFVNPESKNTFPVNAAPPIWDLFATTGFSAALTVQPNDQKWLYVRKSSTKWFGIYSQGGAIVAVCGDKPFTLDSDKTGNYTGFSWIDVAPKNEWIDLKVSQSGSKTWVASRHYVDELTCPAIPLVDGTDYGRIVGDNTTNPAKIARAMLFRRGLSRDELSAEASPGPLVWSDPTTIASGNKVKSRRDLVFPHGEWLNGSPPSGGVIDKNAAGVSKTLSYAINNSLLDPTVDDGAERPFTVGVRFRVDKVNGVDGNILLARRGSLDTNTADFEVRLRCSQASWNGCRVFILSPGDAHGQPSRQWRVDHPIAWGQEYGLAISWPANGIVEGATPGTASVDLKPRVAIDGKLQNKTEKGGTDHVADILSVWKMWGNHNRPKPTGKWAWQFGGVLDSADKLALRDVRIYPYAVNGVDAIYARCANLGCGDAGQKCVDPGPGNEAASAVCYGCDDQHTPVAGLGPLDYECRKKSLFNEECVVNSDCKTGLCDTQTYRCRASDTQVTDAICGEAIEGTTLALGCPAGSVITNITYASYGKPTGTCDTGFSNSSCHAGGALQKVKDACLGKTTCGIDAKNTVFVDPCSGQQKKLVVQAVCTSGKSGCDEYCFERGRSCDAAPGGGYRCGNCVSGFTRLPGYDKLPAHHPGLECTWAPFKKQGELCGNSAECLSGACGNTRVEPIPFKIHAHVRWWSWGSLGSIPDFDGLAIESSRPTNKKVCFGEDSKHCDKAFFVPHPFTVDTPDCKKPTVYDCKWECNSQYRSLQWTVLAPETCRDIQRYTLSKWPGTDSLAYWYVTGKDTNVAKASYYSNSLTLQDLKNIVLRDQATYNNNVDRAKLTAAGVGRALLAYAQASGNQTERNKLIAQYGNFGSLSTCHHNSAYTGVHNRQACEPNLQPIGSACPPPGEADNLKHDFCVTNYCARDTKKCEFGEHPLLEPRPNAGNQDRQGKRDVKFGLVRLIDTTIETQETDKNVLNKAEKWRYVADLTNAYCMRMFGAWVPPFPLMMSIFHLDRTKGEGCSEYQFKAYIANKALSHGQPKPLLGSCTGLQINNGTICSQAACEPGPLITGNLSELADSILGSFTSTVGGAAPGCLPLEGTPVGELIDKLTILKTQTVGPIPLAVQFGPTLDICIDPLVDMGSTGIPKLTVRPSIGLGIDARGGIGVAEGKGKSKAIKFWAGVQLLLDIVKLGFPVGWGVDIDDVAAPGYPPFIWKLKISQKIGIDLEMFSGSFGIFAEVALGPFTIGFSVKLFAWTGLLFEWDLSETPIWDTKLDFAKPKVIGTSSTPNHDHSGWFSGQTCNGLCK